MYALVSLERLSLHVVGIGFASSADLTKYRKHRGSWWYLWNEWIYTALIFFLKILLLNNHLVMATYLNMST